MGFQFSETMAGTVAWDSQPGPPQPFSFEVTAEAESTRTHLRDGKAALRGVVHAPPIAAAGAAEGVITIRPLGQRIIRYELAFRGDDGRTYRVFGEKAIRLSSPIHSFTYLPAEILDDQDRRVGVCEARFDHKRDLWSFLRSFRRL